MPWSYKSAENLEKSLKVVADIILEKKYLIWGKTGFSGVKHEPGYARFY